ncbi:type II toxin-antitoxin system HicA family toxin [Dehalococcoidia bacterium]|nr:type II toxin-antitoxin system HicA family toxin [Dehalococcoidia bacterium]MCL0038872.1 type II toxin-antitoxin system HicA family toxin [Dehalococcoidia bacterium]MCL0090865.1 type II toxin-antitoxin system HicA family toxin [Dehalococcoidia bacterium]MCL0092959.1 type II toxin-antitoxin system HicA family toxin [Dehalococcoidia bacterium]MCL0098713.1 type II toxin-antitoxin system HicA family toxin [Dehalococcoidia bacterium]
MQRLPVLSGRQAARAFEKAGFLYDHHTGSHMIYYRPDGRHLSIPDHRELDRGTLRALIRRASLTVEDFRHCHCC